MGDLPDLATRWLDWLATDRGMSEHTIRTYLRTLRTLPDADTASRADIEAWWHERSSHPAATRVNELAALRSFYRWMRTFEHRGDDPTARISPPRVPKGLPRPISRADLLTLMGTLDGDVRRAVALGAYGGLRVSEAAALQWLDVDLENHRLRIRGKGQKTRLVGIGATLLDAILPDTGGSVVSAGGRTYTAASLQRRVNRAIRAAGVDVTYHQLRHRFGTVALAATGNLLAVSRAMGHSSPASTAIYAATSDADLDVIAEAVAR